MPSCLLQVVACKFLLLEKLKTPAERKKMYASFAEEADMMASQRCQAFVQCYGMVPPPGWVPTGRTSAGRTTGGGGSSSGNNAGNSSSSSNVGNSSSGSAGPQARSQQAPRRARPAAAAAGGHPRRPALIMELVQGGSLRGAIEQLKAGDPCILSTPVGKVVALLSIATVS